MPPKRGSASPARGAGGASREQQDESEAPPLRYDRQLGDMAGGYGLGLQSPLVDRPPPAADPKRRRLCCCGVLLTLVWGATLALVYGAEQPCAVVRGWHGPAAVPTLGCSGRWGGSCPNHTYVDFLDDPLFFGCQPTKCTPGSSELCPGAATTPCPKSGQCPGHSAPKCKPGSSELCPGVAHIPCPESGQCPGDSAPGTPCAAWQSCRPPAPAATCPRPCPRLETDEYEWCVENGYGKWVSTAKNCTEPPLAVCEGDSGEGLLAEAGALGCAPNRKPILIQHRVLLIARKNCRRWGTGAHAPPGATDKRSPQYYGLSVAEGGHCRRGGRCMCTAAFMPSTRWIILWIIALVCVSALSACGCACLLWFND